MTVRDGGASLIAMTRDGFCCTDYPQTLINCRGLYECPVDAEGRLLGPLVGYAGTYPAVDPGAQDAVPECLAAELSPPERKHYVGLAYYNYSMADQWPAVNRAFAGALACKVQDQCGWPDVLLCAPMAGIPLSMALSEELQCRRVYAEKRVIALGRDGQRDEEELVLPRYDIDRGERVLIGEELVNNISSAEKLVRLIEESGGIYAGIACAINRSAAGLTEFMGQPIVSVLHVPTPQYRQDDPLVVDALARGLPIIWKPKPAWAQLKAAMDQAKASGSSRDEHPDLWDEVGNVGTGRGLRPRDPDKRGISLGSRRYGPGLRADAAEPPIDEERGDWALPG